MGLVARKTLTLRSLVLIALSNASIKEGQAHWLKVEVFLSGLNPID
jgi:hypothetical protein